MKNRVSFPLINSPESHAHSSRVASDSPESGLYRTYIVRVTHPDVHVISRRPRLVSITPPVAVPPVASAEILQSAVWNQRSGMPRSKMRLAGGAARDPWRVSTPPSSLNRLTMRFMVVLLGPLRRGPELRRFLMWRYMYDCPRNSRVVTTPHDHPADVLGPCECQRKLRRARDRGRPLHMQQRRHELRRCPKYSHTSRRNSLPAPGCSHIQPNEL